VPSDDLTAAELDALYTARREPMPAPLGVWQGVVVGRVASPGARRRVPRVAQWIGFEVPRWGIDFDAGRWWFVHPNARVGRFRSVEGPSRWRPVDVLQLHYDGSRLPRAIRGRLYDELRLLEPDFILGIGGENAPVGEGDHFWFILRPHSGSQAVGRHPRA
jgi:hypothetical protein